MSGFEGYPPLGGGLDEDNVWGNQASLNSRPSSPLLAAAEEGRVEDPQASITGPLDGLSLEGREGQVQPQEEEEEEAKQALGRAELPPRPPSPTRATPDHDPASAESARPASLTSDRKRSMITASLSSLVMVGGEDPLRAGLAAGPLGASDVGPLSASASTTPLRMDVGLPSTPVEVFTALTVSNPQKIDNVVTPYVVYKVDCRSTIAHSVLRRFRDFDALYQTLVCTHPGVIVPPIPEKAVLGRFAEEFVERRRLVLEKCLKKMCAHPVLRSDALLADFLTQDKFDIVGVDCAWRAFAAAAAAACTYWIGQNMAPPLTCFISHAHPRTLAPRPCTRNPTTLHRKS
jgi:hypothetical protein